MRVDRSNNVRTTSAAHAHIQLPMFTRPPFDLWPWTRCWLLFHPNVIEPLAVEHNASDKKRAKMLYRGERPSLTQAPELVEECAGWVSRRDDNPSAPLHRLWNELTHSQFFSVGWETEAAQRPSAREFLQLFRAASIAARNGVTTHEY